MTFLPFSGCDCLVCFSPCPWGSRGAECHDLFFFICAVQYLSVCACHSCMCGASLSMSTAITHLTAHPVVAEISQSRASGAGKPGRKTSCVKKKNSEIVGMFPAGERRRLARTPCRNLRGTISFFKGKVLLCTVIIFRFCCSYWQYIQCIATEQTRSLKVNKNALFRSARNLWQHGKHRDRYAATLIFTSTMLNIKCTHLDVLCKSLQSMWQS